jgi:hypothetical protein
VDRCSENRAFHSFSGCNLSHLAPTVPGSVAERHVRAPRQPSPRPASGFPAGV